MSNFGPYAKFLVTLIGVVLTGLNVLYGTEPGVQLATMVATSLGVYQARNTPQP